jgi:hypothetical protein
VDKLTIPCNLGPSIQPSHSDYWLKSSTPYPYPRFQEEVLLTDREFQIIFIENSLVEYSFLPEFGGRLVGIRDKRTGKYALQMPTQMEFDNGKWEHGIAFGDLGMTSFAIMLSDFELGHGGDEEEAATLVLYSTSPINQVSSQVRISLSSDSPWLNIECSLINRSLAPSCIESGFWFCSPEQANASYGKDWLCVSANGDDCWTAIRFSEGDFSEFRRSNRSVNLLRMNSTHSLGGAMTDSWSVSLCPLTGISSVDFIDDEFGMGVSRGRLTVVSQHGRPKCPIKLTSSNEELFQTTVDLYSEQPMNTSLDAIGELSSIAIGDGERQICHSFLQSPASRLAAGSNAQLGSGESPSWECSKSILEAIDLLDCGEDPSSYARSARIHAADRAIASTILATHACRQSDWDLSLTHIDQALSHEASNGLLWWMRAVVNRQKGETEEQPDRLNAHFLLPLEPALRAEAFLCQPAVTSMDPIPLVAPVAMHQTASAEIAAMYWNLGLFRDVVRWVDECCRHRESSWLRIIHAAAYLKLRGKEIEAHTQLQFATRAGLGAPFPTTELEFRILEDLRTRFPGTQILEEWAELVQKVR